MIVLEKVGSSFLKLKTKGLIDLRNGNSWLKKQTSRVIKCLREDNGLEFCCEEFNKFWQENGIVRHRTVRFTPQQHGWLKGFIEPLCKGLDVYCLILFDLNEKS